MREDDRTGPLMTRAALPPGAGIGLRDPHIDAVLNDHPPAPFLEVHAENHMGEGRAFDTLAAVRRDYPVSIHGVGLSLGGAEPPDARHLGRFAELVRRIQPALVSEHLSWCRIGDVCLNDLLPVRYDAAALEAVARNVSIVQDAIGRPILMENPSLYVAFDDADIPETEFLATLCRRTGCGVLLDVNNIVVSAGNLGFAPEAWLAALPAHLVGEIHLAGHEDAGDVLIDTHGAPIGDAVWRLYANAVRRFGAKPTLIERDQNIPPLAELLAEAARADSIASAAVSQALHADAA